MSEIKDGRLGLDGTEHSKCNHMITLGFKGLKHFCTTVVESNKTMLANRDNASSLLCVFISQYCNKVDFISMSEAQRGAKLGASPNWGPGPPCLPSEPPLLETADG